MAEIRLMTEFEILKTQQTHNSTQVVYGTYGFNEIALGNGNTSDIRSAQTINHETIHEVLTHEISEGMSMRLDRDLYYNFAVCSKSQDYKGLTVREALLELFTIDEITYI